MVAWRWIPRNARARSLVQPVRPARSRLRVRSGTRKRLLQGRRACRHRSSSRQHGGMAPFGDQVPAPAGVRSSAAQPAEVVMATVNLDELRKRTQESLNRVRGRGTEAEIAQARDLVEELRNARQYPELIQLAEAISRRFPDDARSRRLYAQGLIEQGMATVAIDVLKALAARLPKEHPEQAEASGLLGRAYKQIFFDAGDKTSDGARTALKQAIAIYRKAFEDNEANTWHGVNLVALLTRARRLGMQVAKGLQPDEVARRVIAQLNAVPTDKRDEWHLPTLAEASLGLDDWSAVEAALKSYVADDKAQAFQIAS